MTYINKSMFFGIISSEIKTKELNDDNKVVSFSLFIPSPRKISSFINCKAFGKTAELISKYLKRKMPLIITDAELSTEKWQNKEGEDKERIVFIIKDFTFCNSKETTKNDSNTEDKNIIEEDSVISDKQESIKDINNDIPF